AGALHDLDARARVVPDLGAEVEGDPPAARDRIDELAVAGPDVEDGGIGLDVALEEATAKHTPDALLVFLLGRVEAQRIQPWQFQGRRRPPTFAASDRRYAASS